MGIVKLYGTFTTVNTEPHLMSLGDLSEAGDTIGTSYLGASQPPAHCWSAWSQGNRSPISASPVPAKSPAPRQ